jgi:hypothetical protein
MAACTTTKPRPIAWRPCTASHAQGHAPTTGQSPCTRVPTTTAVQRLNEDEALLLTCHTPNEPLVSNTCHTPNEPRGQEEGSDALLSDAQHVRGCVCVCLWVRKGSRRPAKPTPALK